MGMECVCIWKEVGGIGEGWRLPFLQEDAPEKLKLGQGSQSPPRYVPLHESVL